jgi:hypothetical protein
MDKIHKLEAAGFVWNVITTKVQKHTWEESFTAWKQAAAEKGPVKTVQYWQVHQQETK